MTMSPAELGFVRDLVRRGASVVLSQDQTYLIESRLIALAQELGFRDAASLVSRAHAEPGGAVAAHIIRSMLTNETSFFRDANVFTALKQSILPNLVGPQGSSNSLSVWSAASSSGQELYSVMMLLMDAFPLTQHAAYRFVGTDLSSTMIEQAKAGRYSLREVRRGLSADLLRRHFVSEGGSYRVNKELRNRAEFRTLNLATVDTSAAGFDLVLLRNVLIYFDDETRRAVTRTVTRSLKTGGYLILGATESLDQIPADLERVVLNGVTVYRVLDAARAQTR